MALESDQAVEVAINRVLEAEARARQAVDLCQRQADEIIERARAHRKRIAERTERRIGRLRARFAQQVARQLASFKVEAKAYSEHPAAGSPGLDSAVASLAAELTGEPP